MELNFNGIKIEFKTPLSYGDYCDFASLCDKWGVIEIGPEFKQKAITIYSLLSNIDKIRFIRYNFQCAYIIFRKLYKTIANAYNIEFDKFIEITTNVYDNFDLIDVDEKIRLIVLEFAGNYIKISGKLEKEVGFNPTSFPLYWDELEKQATDIKE